VNQSRNISTTGWERCSTSVILTTWEVEIGRITVQGQPEQKVSETPSQQINWLMLVIPATQEA
jgi:hypothetical protein